jgi:hypothetical protein
MSGIQRGSSRPDGRTSASTSSPAIALRAPVVHSRATNCGSRALAGWTMVSLMVEEPSDPSAAQWKLMAAKTSAQAAAA